MLLDRHYNRINPLLVLSLTTLYFYILMTVTYLITLDKKNKFDVAAGLIMVGVAWLMFYRVFG